MAAPTQRGSREEKKLCMTAVLAELFKLFIAATWTNFRNFFRKLWARDKSLQTTIFPGGFTGWNSPSNFFLNKYSGK